MQVTFNQDRLLWLAEGNLKKIVNSMSIEEKVGQCIISFFHGAKLTETARQTIQKARIGSVIYYGWANELTDPKKVKELSDDIQNYAKKVLGLPIHIVVDQEGGIVSRLTCNFTEFPGNMALAATGDPDLAYKVGLAMGKEMQAVGIPQTLAPVVDVNNAPATNPVIGTRSFGDHVDLVIKYAKKFIEGLHAAGSLCTLKHDPGHGRTVDDSHTKLPMIDINREEFNNVEQAPFVALQDQADAIMTAHVLIPAIDPEHCATLSSKFLTGIVRKKRNYEGPIFSDSIVMKGVVPNQNTMAETVKGVTQAAVQTLSAGADAVILGRLEWASFEGATTPDTNQKLVLQVIEGITQAVRDEKIAKSRLDEAVIHILQLKQKALNNNSIPDLSIVKCKEHVGLAHEVAQKALTLVSPSDLLSKIKTQLSDRKVIVVAPVEIENNLKKALENYPSVKTKLFQNNPSSMKQVFDEIQSYINETEMTIFLSYNGHAWKDQLQFLKDLENTIPAEKLVVAGVRNPQDVMRDKAQEKHLVYLTYSHSEISLKAFFDALERHITPPGVLPMSV